jgi:hypothetical protein
MVVLSRLKIQTGFLRQSTRTNCPSSSLLISTSIGAPAAFALADGFHVSLKNRQVGEKWVSDDCSYLCKGLLKEY